MDAKSLKVLLYSFSTALLRPRIVHKPEAAGGQGFLLVRDNMPASHAMPGSQ